ncbi:MAG: NADH:flavin oxidoreductase [Bacteroidetes bacterium]|nr:NADH:flavin oxidoreductase [Bacteroidota bacterium]
MNSLFSSYKLKSNQIKNRVVFPPVVCFHYSGNDGIVNNRNLDHYREIASGGAGIVITEATAVWKEGRLAPFQLGVWSDDHIEGMSRIAATVKSQGALSLLQIHHAGIIAPESVSAEVKCPSEDEKNPRSKALTLNEIDELSQAFIQGAMRAREAGFNGVELHGAHGYLLNQFASSYFNRRDDDYGGNIENNLRFATRIIRGIRQKCGSDFIIGYRLGANSPTLDDGILIAKHLEQAGVDLLHVSHGGILQNLPRTPAGFEFNWIVYSGTVIKTHVEIPVIVVNEIKTPERAALLIEQNMADFVALGRPQLADPQWVNHVRNHQEPIRCLSCKPKCRWYEDSSLCPARNRAANPNQ